MKLFDFDERRLTDFDEDGWFEYQPKHKESYWSKEHPPLVYFDAGTYGMILKKEGIVKFTGYPVVGRPGASPKSAELRQRWGLAVPYASAVYDPPRPTNYSTQSVGIAYVNPEDIQIIDAGDDGRYCDDEHAAEMRIPIFPSGDVYYQHDGFTTPEHGYDRDEADNCVNFADSPLAQQAERNQ
jgi:hypothetical protein